jgi:lipopolysaccharide transport system ATP-binding protein
LSDDVVIRVEGVSKKFCRSLKRSMWYGFQDITRDVLSVRTNGQKLRPQEFWAVDDVSFELKKGQTLGLIGPNGSGKTTMLKMLNGIILPDRGRVEIKGRVGALIAVGAGFHPQLTGRENIYINGAILEMGKREIDKKFDEIVEFADIGDFLDTPVKHYSSGMYVRLGFAVAVHCEPDILLVDEVLAVGDVDFQAKCYEKIREIVNRGKTIIFVSHQFHNVEKICDRVIVLFEGLNCYEGEANDAIDYYRYRTMPRDTTYKYRRGTQEIIVVNIEFTNSRGVPCREFDMGEPVTCRIYFHAREPVVNPIFSLAFRGPDHTIISHMRTDGDDVHIGEIFGKGYLDLRISALNLLPNLYSCSAGILKKERLAPYDSNDRDYKFLVKGGHRVCGFCYLPHDWVVSM